MAELVGAARAARAATAAAKGGTTQGKGKAKAGRGKAARRDKAEANQAAERSEDPGRQGGRQGESAEGQDTEGQGKAPKIHKIQVEVGKVAFKAARATQGREGARRASRRSTGVG